MAFNVRVLIAHSCVHTLHAKKMRISIQRSDTKYIEMIIYIANA